MNLPVPVRRAVRKMRPYRPPLEGRADKLRLDFNENLAGCPPTVRRALARLNAKQVAMYPEYESTVRKLARTFRVRSAELLLTNGTDDALRLVLSTFVEAGETILLVEPTFAMYRFYAELAGARVLVERYNQQMRFPLSAVLRRLRARPRVLFLANPNNPTGTLLEKAELEQVVRAAKRTIVVVDEAYAEFSGVTLLRRIGRYPNLVVTRTFSKAAGLAGLRLGCLFAQPTLARALRKAHSPYSVNIAALAAAQAVAEDGGFLRRYAQQVKQAREELRHALGTLGVRTFPSGGNFVLVDFGPRAPRLLRRLRERGILLRDRQSDFGRAGFVRVTIGPPAEVRRLIRTLREVW